MTKHKYPKKKKKKKKALSRGNSNREKKCNTFFLSLLLVTVFYLLFFFPFFFFFHSSLLSNFTLHRWLFLPFSFVCPISSYNIMLSSKKRVSGSRPLSLGLPTWCFILLWRPFLTCRFLASSCMCITCRPRHCLARYQTERGSAQTGPSPCVGKPWVWPFYCGYAKAR